MDTGGEMKEKKKKVKVFYTLSYFFSLLFKSLFCKLGFVGLDE